MPRAQIKDERTYRKLRGQGQSQSKEKAARIANVAAASSPGKVGRKGGQSGSYDDWAKQDLMQRAKEIGIKGRSTMSKPQLIKALRGPLIRPGTRTGKESPMSRSVSELSVSPDARAYQGRPYTVLVLAGRLDTASRVQLRQAVIAAAREAAGMLVVDLSQLEYLDGQVLYELVRASHVTRHLGVGLALASSDPDLAHIVKLTGTDQLIALYGSAEEAAAD